MFDRSDILSTSGRPIVSQTGKRFRQLCAACLKTNDKWLWFDLCLLQLGRNIFIWKTWNLSATCRWVTWIKKHIIWNYQYYYNDTLLNVFSSHTFYTDVLVEETQITVYSSILKFLKIYNFLSVFQKLSIYSTYFMDVSFIM